MNKTKESIANGEGAINTHDIGDGSGSVDSSTVKETWNNHNEATNRFKIGDKDNSNKSKINWTNSTPLARLLKPIQFHGEILSPSSTNNKLENP